MSSFDAGSAKTFFTCLTEVKFPFVAGFSFTGSLSIFFTLGAEGIFPFSIVAKIFPETLSPIY